LLHQVPDLPEPTFPSEVEGNIAVGATARLATSAGRPAMAGSPRHRAGHARPFRDVSPAESDGGEGPVGSGRGRACQAIPRLAGRRGPWESPEASRRQTRTAPAWPIVEASPGLEHDPETIMINQEPKAR